MILDTNAYSALDRADVRIVNAIKNETSISLPIVVIAELRFGFANGEKKSENENKLNRFLAQDSTNVLNIGLDTTNIYAELAVFAKKSGKALANNDIWIAALALENKMPLATFDKDFVAFESFLGKNLRILE